MREAKSFRFGIGDEGGEVLIGGDGWLLWHLPRRHVLVLAYVDDGDGAPRLRTLTVMADSSDAELTGQVLRDLPLGRLAAALAHPVLVRALGAARDTGKAPSLRPTGLASALELRHLLERYERVDLDEPKICLRLRIPASRTKDRAFLQTLLGLYEDLKLTSKRPAALIGAANGIEPSLIRQWVKTARERRTSEEEILRSGTARAERLRQELSDEDEAEASWIAEIGRQLIHAGVSWQDYCRDHGALGSPDPIGMWDDAKRRSFLASQDSSRRPA